MALPDCDEANGEVAAADCRNHPGEKNEFNTPGSLFQPFAFSKNAMKTSPNPQPAKARDQHAAKEAKVSRAKGADRKKAEGGKSRQNRRKVTNPDAAGIDIGSREHYVAVPVGRDDPNVRHFSAFTEGLAEMAQWLRRCGVTTVAMESTGVYWLPVYRKLEREGFEVLLVDARGIKYVPGRKSDVVDCQWLQQLHTYGLLRGAFRPADEICELRAFLRHRKNMVDESNRHILHIQKALQEMNLLLHHVLSDVTGESGLRILDAMLAGERDGRALAKLIDFRVKKSPEEVASALHGEYSEPQLFILDQALKSYRHSQGQIEECDRQILRQAQQMQSREAAPAADAIDALQQQTSEPAAATASRKASAKRKCGGKRISAEQELCLKTQLQRILGVDLTQVPGLGVLAVLILLSEIGANMKKWRHAKAFASWLGLCPNTKISGGRILSSRSRKVSSRAATILRVAATALGRTDTPLGHFYRRKQAQLGAPKAITATARKLACLIYRLIETRENYVAGDTREYSLDCRKFQIAALRKRASALGCEILETAVAA
jgi:transposase